jgi:hypothetical protein
MRPHAGAVQEGHAELDPALLHQMEQALPDTQAGPADEGLSSPPLDFVLMPPEDR